MPSFLVLRCASYSLVKQREWAMVLLCMLTRYVTLFNSVSRRRDICLSSSAIAENRTKNTTEATDATLEFP